jgi:hypothetical protein
LTGPNPKIPESTLKAREQLVEIYRDAQKALKAQLQDAALTDFQSFRIREQLAQINAIVEGLNADVKDALPGVIDAYYEYGADLGTAALRAQGVKVAALNMGNRIHTAAVQAVAEQMVQDLAGTNAAIEATSKRILRQTQQNLITEHQLNKTIATGITKGETRRQTSAKLTQQLREQLKDEQFVTINGRKYTPEYYAELVTRTRTREAVTKGAETRGLEYGINEFQVSIHDNPCPKCAPFQGKVYSVGGESEFPEATARPPFHPHCFAPQTMVAAPGMSAVYSGSYAGPMVRVSWSGKWFDVTPNHPILTESGFVRAGDLCTKHYLVGYSKLPPEISESAICEASNQVRAETHIKTTADSFHGDGECLGSSVWAGFAEPKAPDFPLLDTLALLLPPHEDRLNNEHTNLRGLRAVLANHQWRLELFRIESVAQAFYDGPVYDLETASGLYIAEGVIVSNCRHVWVPYVRRPGEKGDEKHKAILTLSKTDGPIADSLPGYHEAVSQARATGNLKKKQLPGEPRTKTVNE